MPPRTICLKVICMNRFEAVFFVHGGALPARRDVSSAYTFSVKKYRIVCNISVKSIDGAAQIGYNATEASPQQHRFLRRYL